MILMIDHDAVVQRANELPPLPQSASRLLSLLADPDTDLREVVQVISFDPILTLKLLRMANSILSASSKHIGTVMDAVVRLGTRTVSNLAVAASVQPLLAKRIPGYNMTGNDFWRHSLAAALATETIRACSKQVISPFVFTAALLHDVGKLVLGQLLCPQILELLARAVIEGKQAAYCAENEILSMHHGEVGGVVAQHWGLPMTIVNGIIHHHDPELGNETMCSVTCLANCVAHSVTDTDSPEVGRESMSCPPDFALQAIGMSEQGYLNLCHTVADRLSVVSAAFKT